jgi:hypothetical protein
MQGPRPLGWDWPLHLTEHVRERMQERGFNALDVRMMMHRPERILAAPGIPGARRWIVEARLRGRTWRVILELEPHVL